MAAPPHLPEKSIMNRGGLVNLHKNHTINEGGGKNLFMILVINNFTNSRLEGELMFRQSNCKFMKRNHPQIQPKLFSCPLFIATILIDSLAVLFFFLMNPPSLHTQVRVHNEE